MGSHGGAAGKTASTYCADNCSVSLAAVPEKGYALDKWVDAKGETVSTSVSFSVYGVHASASYTASFKVDDGKVAISGGNGGFAEPEEEVEKPIIIFIDDEIDDTPVEVPVEEEEVEKDETKEDEKEEKVEQEETKKEEDEKTEGEKKTEEETDEKTEEGEKTNTDKSDTDGSGFVGGGSTTEGETKTTKTDKELPPSKSGTSEPVDR